MLVTGMHPFDAAVHLEPHGAGRMRGRTRPDWANMVSPFGGITAAVLLRAIEQHPDSQGEPLALTVNFLTQIADDDFDIDSRAVRINRTNQHWIAELSQRGQVTTTATAVFGTHRDTWVDTEAEPPPAPRPEETAPGGFAEGIAWAHNYDMRFVEGAVPREGDRRQPSSTTTLWVRDVRSRKHDFAALAALSDVFYPRVFLRRGGFVPAGTVTLTTYFHLDTRQLDELGGDFVLGTARANRFSGGYFDQSGQLWSRDGALLASSHQLVYFKDQGSAAR